MQYIQHGWINPDSVLYFESARLFALGEWKQAVEVFRWPLYALLIAAVHNITTLSIHLSAQVLNVVFFGIATASFIKLIQLAGGKNKAMLAGALILFSTQYIVGDVLEMLLRDEGFWAFFLLSLVFFIRYYKTGHLYDALFWQLCAMTATLFRIEGITYLIGLPFVLLFAQQQIGNRVHQYLIANSVSLIAIVSVLGITLLSDDLSINSFGRLHEVFTLRLYDELTQQLFVKASIMSQQVLGQHLDEFATQGLLLTFLYVMLAKMLSTTGVINVGLAFFAIKTKPSLVDQDTFHIVKVAAVIAIINMALIITKVFVLSGRYVVPLAFLLMILASLFLANTFKYLESAKKSDTKWKWFIVALLTVMLLSIIKNVLPKQTGYNYMQDAVSWLKQNNATGQTVFYDDPRARYYANQPFISKWTDNWAIVTSAIENKSVYHYEYLMINHASKHPEREKFILEQLPNYREIKRFEETKAKKYIVIYQKSTL
ncbi:MAG: hypothetical protein ACT4OH_02105 [Methylophilaceae bacterium]